MTAAPDPRPFLVVTAILDQAARPAAVTRSHGEALDRALRAAGKHAIAGLDVVELPIAHPSFTPLRDHFGYPKDTVAIYDLFPLAAHLDGAQRRAAAQFLAAEVLWTLDAQGQLGGAPLNVRLDLPSGWDRDLKAVHERLMAVGALDLSAEAIETFKAVKAAWESLAPKS
jgi:hypothetical protein